MQVAIKYGFEAPQLVQRLIKMKQAESAFQKSICHFFGLGVPKSNQKAVDAFRTLDSSSYSLMVEEEGMNHSIFIHHIFFGISLDFIDTTAIRGYTDFLFKSNQFLPFLLLTFHNGIYSSRKL